MLPCISASDSFILSVLARPRVRAAHTAQSKELQLLVLLKCFDIVNILKSMHIPSQLLGVFYGIRIL